MSAPRQSPGRPLPPRRTPPGATPPKRRGPRWWAVALLLFVLALIIVSATGVAYVYALTRNLPDVTTITWDLSTTVYDKDAKEIRKLSSTENRTFTPIKKIPLQVQNTFVAIEDHLFWTHHGLYLPGLLRAALEDVLYKLHVRGATFQGASTITQQLAKRVFTGDEVSIRRKVQEAAVAILMERTYTKEEILEKYLNVVYFGNNASGIEAASQVYFRKSADQLDLAQAAVLAGLLQAPSGYDPYNVKIVPGQPIIASQAATARQQDVLTAMERYGYATHDQVAAARAEKLVLAGRPDSARATYTGGWFIDYVVNLLTDRDHAGTLRYGLPTISEDQLFTGGYKIYTTMDTALQQSSEQSIRDRMNQYDKDFKFGATKPEAASVTMEVKTGKVLAIVGGRDHSVERAFNRATDATRQPGSSIKPIGPYLAAIQSGMGPGSTVDDAPFQLNADGRIYPENYDFAFRGFIPLRTALKQSVNVVAYKLALKVGPLKILKNLQDLGLTTLVDKGPTSDVGPAPMALGGLTKGVHVIDIAHAYATLGNGGSRVDPIVITEIRDKDDKAIWKAKPAITPVVNPVHAWLIDNMLESVMSEPDGFGRQAMNGWPDLNPLKHHAGGKTGTTENNTDAWFVGMTPSVVTAVWTGFDQSDKNTLPHDWTGAFQPSDMWNRIMVAATKNLPDEEFPKPKTGLKQVAIDRKSGMLPGLYSPRGDTYLEWFADGTEPKAPTGFDNLHKAVQICMQGGKPTLWRDGCGCVPETRVFLVRPDKWIVDPHNPKRAPDDANQEPPAAYCAAAANPTPTPTPTPTPPGPNPNGVPLIPSPSPSPGGQQTPTPGTQGPPILGLPIGPPPPTPSPGANSSPPAGPSN